MQMHMALSKWLNGSKLLSKYSTNSELLRNIPHRSGICRFLFARNNNNYFFLCFPKLASNGSNHPPHLYSIGLTLLEQEFKKNKNKATFCKYQGKNTLVSSGSQFKTSLLLCDARGSHSAHGLEYWPFYELSLSFWK